MSDGDYVSALRLTSLTRCYDPVVGLTTRERRFKDRLIAQARPQAGDRILDLGCGTGTLALAIKEVAPGAELTGLDADPEMLDRARAKATEAEVAIGFDEGLSNELPYEDQSFDKVVSTLFFHHVELDVKQATLREVLRVLRSGAELHVADWGRPSDPAMWVLSRSIRLLDGAEPTRDNLTGRLPSLFEDAGLVSVEQTGQLRTVFGTIAFYRAARPGSAAAT